MDNQIPQEQPQQTPPAPPPFTPRNSLRWLKFLIVGVVTLLIISVFGVGSYLLGSNRNAQETVAQITAVPTPTPTPDPASNAANATASWKTYTNTAIGFEIKYPPDYGAPILPTGPIGPNPVATDKETDTAMYFCKTPNDCFGLYIFPFAEGSLETAINSSTAKGIPPYDWTQAELVEELEIGGIKAKWLKAGYTNGSLQDKFEGIFFTNKGYGFIFHDFSSTDKNTFDQTLSTFKFTQ